MLSVGIIFLFHSSSFVLKRPSMSEKITAIPTFSTVITSCHLNASHQLYYVYYLASLGYNRFTNLQLVVLDIWSFSMKYVSFMDIALFAIQLGLASAKHESLFMHLFSLFTKDLYDGSVAASGKKSMISYFLTLLLQLVYSQTAMIFDEKNTISLSAKYSCCSVDLLTEEDIVTNIGFVSSEKMLNEILGEITTQSFDMRRARNVYQLKSEVIHELAFFDRNPILYEANTILDVMFSLRY